MISFELPLKTASELNGSHRHWAVKATRMRRARNVVAPFVPRHKISPVLRVELVRISAGILDDDNLRSALKGVRDGVATKLGIDDGSPLIRWEYQQEPGPKKVYRVRVTIEALR